MRISIFWFRRDLRLNDNTALIKALNGKLPVLPFFIFDNNITDELPVDDARISFIYDTLRNIQQDLLKQSGSLLIISGDPIDVIKRIISEYPIRSVYFNRDTEKLIGGGFITADETIRSNLKVAVWKGSYRS